MSTKSLPLSRRNKGIYRPPFRVEWPQFLNAVDPNARMPINIRDSRKDSDSMGTITVWGGYAMAQKICALLNRVTRRPRRK